MNILWRQNVQLLKKKMFCILAVIRLLLNKNTKFCLVWFDFFVLWHINFQRLFDAQTIFVEELLWYYLIYSWENKGVHTFPKSLKVNVMVWFGFMVYQCKLMPNPFLYSFFFFAYHHGNVDSSYLLFCFLNLDHNIVTWK